MGYRPLTNCIYCNKNGNCNNENNRKKFIGIFTYKPECNEVGCQYKVNRYIASPPRVNRDACSNQSTRDDTNGQQSINIDDGYICIPDSTVTNVTDNDYGGGSTGGGGSSRSWGSSDYSGSDYSSSDSSSSDSDCSGCD